MLALVLVNAVPSGADIGVIVLEPVGPLGFFTRVGHAGTYLSNICPDGSPIRMRLCLPGEAGGVVSKYSPFSENENFDWAIVPFEEYLHGFWSPDVAPLIGTRKLQRAIEQHNFGTLFSRTLAVTTPGTLPDGQWKAALATRFDRSLYIFSVATTPIEDAALIAAFNAAPNASRFNFFYRNCSDQARAIFDLILPATASIGSRTSGLTMVTPKGLAHALVRRARERPELHLQVRRYPQVPGTFGRSRDVLFPMENTYRSAAFAPWWFFGGFREVALGAMFYHHVISPFSLRDSSRDFISPWAAQLTLEQGQLRQRQDEIRLALVSTRNDQRRQSRLWQMNESIVRRLATIRTDKRAEVSRIEGSKAHWQELDRGFRSRVRALSGQHVLPEELTRHLARFEPNGRLSGHLLRYFEHHGDFYVDEAGRGPWLRLQLADGETRATGLSTSQVLAGDQQLAVLVLAAVLDYNLYQSEARREDIDYVDGLFDMFTRAGDAIGR